VPNTDVFIGTLYSFSSASYTASVQPDGALTTFLKNVPVSRQLLPSLLQDGTRVAVLMFDENNQADAMVVGVTSTAFRSPSCRVYRNAAQSIPSGDQTAVSFTTVRHDTMAPNNGPMWAAGDPTHIVIRHPGIYIATACIEFAANAAGLRAAAIFDTLSNQFIAITEIPAVNGDTTDITCSSGPFEVPAASSFQLFVIQTSGGALNLNASPAFSPELSVALVG
jgi:hypothetical protein